MITALGFFLVWIGVWTLLDMICGAGRDGSWWWRSPHRILLGLATWLGLVLIFVH